MPSQQVVSHPANAAMFLVYMVDGSDAAADAVRDVLGDMPGLTRSVGFRTPESELLSIVGIGSDLWDRLFPDRPRPTHLHTFEEIRGGTHTAVCTAGDLLIHLRAARMDVVFELARVITDKLGTAATVVDEVHGFRYFDERDLLGFVDGTENPEGEDAVDAAVIGGEDATYAGGSYVIVQKYLHDMAAWNALSTEDQEKVIGRTKLDDLELDDEHKPSNSHVALNDIDGDIVRENMPFGSVGDAEFGTYFIGYAKDPAVTEQMLRNMFVGVPEGNYDRILDFSTAVTGSLYFVPSPAFLDGLGD
ncbi:Dyp-type peroxidase [Corynebacterium variabile]|uniref:Dyp-type peroxidase n=1 Tax=Corynebacterium variabile TaxID=1727 RepID=UPI003A913727